MSLTRICILSIFILGLYAQSTLDGYYLDSSYNLVQVPVLSLPNYLKNASVIGVASFFNLLEESGWSYLQVSTNPRYSDYQQMYAAGFLEGSASYQLIWDAWNNFNEFMLFNASKLPPQAQAFVTNQTNWMRQAIELNSNSNYFKLVNATLGQQQGLFDGYTKRVNDLKRKDMLLSYDQFYFLTNMGDLEDIIPAFNRSTRKTVETLECSAFIKLTNDELIVSHNTYNMYAFMLRVFKSYNIPLQNPLVKVKTLMFSSRPGDLESKDDFYMLDNNLVVVETSLGNFNESNYDTLNYRTVPSWIRHLVANRIASTGREWGNAFLEFRSGTHNNQWMVIDYNKYNTYKKNMKSAEGIVWMVEEFYSLQSAVDVTQELLVNQGYVARYNMPYNKQIYDVSGYEANYKFNYTNDPRAVLFKKYANTVVDLQSMKHLIRYNNISDTGDLCNSIAPRCDLMPKGAFTFGAIDAKITNSKMLKQMIASIISGPTDQDLPPFSWSDWKSGPHRGMPETFYFGWVVYQAIVGPLYFEDK